jgi:hypothetical protein
MKVMTLHTWFDDDVVSVRFDSGNDNIREIDFKKCNMGTFLISRDDVIALAKEFGLAVYNKYSQL